MPTFELSPSRSVWRHKKRLKRRDATKSKIKQKLRIKFGNPSFKICLSTSVFILSGFLSQFSLQSFFLDLFLWRHTWHFPALPLHALYPLCITQNFQYFHDFSLDKKVETLFHSLVMKSFVHNITQIMILNLFHKKKQKQ